MERVRDWEFVYWTDKKTSKTTRRKVKKGHVLMECYCGYIWTLKIDEPEPCPQCGITVEG